MRTDGWSEILIGRDHLENLGVDGGVLLTCTLQKREGGCGYIYLDKGRDQLQAVVKAAKRLRI
jgi:hypothetical protein